MLMRLCRFLLLLVLSSLVSASQVFSQDPTNERQIEVALRMIGHQVLLDAGDETSRVLPITKEADRYRISFGEEFEFRPDDLASTVDSVVMATGMASYYLVEVEECSTEEIVYSFMVQNLTNSDLIPCGSRAQPKGCYNLLFTILDANCLLEKIQSSTHISNPNVPLNKSSLVSLLLIPLLFLLAWAGYLWKRKGLAQKDDNIIPIGEYLFDRRNMKLMFEDTNVELTSKEADLLSLLYSSANETLKREHILNDVWGDNGDYIGRTLDVFISKLRKKLQADPSIKIANIRGVGYKLVLNDL